MRKRGAPHSTRRCLDTMALASQGASLLSKHDQSVRALNTRMAIDDILRGVRDVATWRIVFDMSNLIEALCKNPRVARGASEFVDSLQGAIVGIMDRQKAGNSTAMHAAEIAVLRDAHALFLELLAMITCRDLYEAEVAVADRMRHALSGRMKGVTIVEALA